MLFSKVYSPWYVNIVLFELLVLLFLQPAPFVSAVFDTSYSVFSSFSTPPTPPSSTLAFTQGDDDI